MIYFLIPKTNLFTYTKLKFSDTDREHLIVSSSLSYYLSNIKEKINIHEKEWDIYKKYTNPYEYIHTIIPNKKKSVSKYKPLSRSYFKMIEIISIFKPSFNYNGMIENIMYSTSEFNVSAPSATFKSSTQPRIKINNYFTPFRKSNAVYPLPDLTPHRIPSHNIKPPINTFHLAEGPGGFIEAIVEIRKNKLDTYIGMTILDDNKDDYNIPSWKKSEHFLKENPNVFIENGIDNTGNILNIENFIYCKNKYASSMDLITGDGGFDFSMDFNNQEINITRLLYGQISYALCLQKLGGTFILKIFDSFMTQTIDLIYLLSSFYEKVYISKPQTSRYANSEKYIICKNFLFSSCDDFYPFLLDTFKKMNESKKMIHRFLSVPISIHFLTKIEEYNSIFGQQQIENIYYTLSIIETKNKTEKIDYLIRTNIQKCIHWCVKFGVPYNQITNSNVFLFNGGGGGGGENNKQ